MNVSFSFLKPDGAHFLNDQLLVVSCRIGFDRIAISCVVVQFFCDLIGSEDFLLLPNLT